MTFNKLRLVLCCLALIILAAGFSSISLNAQSTTQGSIDGTVLDSSGAVVPDAPVDIVRSATGFTVDLKSDSSGYFKAPLLEPGTYTVSISAPNFAKYRADNVIVLVGQVTSLEPRLAVASSATEVIVTEQTPVMNLQSPDFSSTLNTTALQNIPINNRRWSALALSTPGVVVDTSGYGLISVRGISTLLNNVEIDGADDNQAFFSEERGRTREAYSTAGSAVREFAVNTGVYSAEYGRAAGGVVTSVTKSGTNQLHGQAYFYDRESNWNAFNDYRVPNDLRERRHNQGAHQARGPAQNLRLHRGRSAHQGQALLDLHLRSAHPRLPGARRSVHPGAVLHRATSCVVYGRNLQYNDRRTGRGSQPLISTTPTSALWPLARASATLRPPTTGPLCSLAVPTSPSAAIPAPPHLRISASTPSSGWCRASGIQEINTPKLDWQVSPKHHVSVLFHRLRWDSPSGVQTTNPDHVCARILRATTSSSSITA